MQEKAADHKTGLLCWGSNFTKPFLLFPIVSENGTAETTFTVHAKTAADNETNPDTGATTGPDTGDNRMMWMRLVLLFVSGTGIAKAAVSGKRKRAE